MQSSSKCRVNIKKVIIKKIISGGQTGADQAALDVAIKLDIPHCGWIPKGRKTEAGPLPDKYKLKEMPTTSYPERTEQNVIDSDGTVIISHGKLTGGSKLTDKLAEKHLRPCLHIDLNKTATFMAATIINTWIDLHKIKTLNVAGPRASKDPKIYQKVSYIIEGVYYLSLVNAILPEIMTTDPLIVEDFVKEIVSELSFKERATIAHMDEEDVELLQDVFNMYIKSKTGVESDDHYEYTVIMKMLWEKLRKTHKLRVVK